MKRKIFILYTGGTIGMEKDYETDSLRPFDFQNIISKIPEIKLLDCHIFFSEFTTPLDSSDMGPEQWQEIAKIIEKEYVNYDGFLILHGTDTMSYTASALSFMLNGLRKPIVITGSQLPIGDLRTDAKENLLTSLYYANLYENNQAVLQEVVIYFEYKLMRGNRSKKMSAEFFDAYISPNYPILGQSGVHLVTDKNLLYRFEPHQDFSVDLHLCTDIFILKLFPGLSKLYMDQLLKMQNLKVLVMEVFGSGTIFSNKMNLDILKQLRQKGVEIVVVSQCFSGSVQFGKYSNSRVFNEIGALSGDDITLESALVKSMHLLGNPGYQSSFSELFAQNLRGEKKEVG